MPQRLPIFAVYVLSDHVGAAVPARSAKTSYGKMQRRLHRSQYLRRNATKGTMGGTSDAFIANTRGEQMIRHRLGPGVPERSRHRGPASQKKAPAASRH